MGLVSDKGQEKDRDDTKLQLKLYNSFACSARIHKVLTYYVPSLYKINDRRTKEITKHETTYTTNIH